jgi:hypothetical protein
MVFQLTFSSVCKGCMKSCDTVVRWVGRTVRNLDIFSSSFVSHQSSLPPHTLCTSASANSQFKHANRSYNLKDEQDIMVSQFLGSQAF